ncbi:MULTISPECIES: HAMP domain-containing sensor histidine kinase [unclassified Legionella]|uniref:sensor histidine kinase n=1 Tax=unclassified Legionella TaxID=2622702 RepID=UPI0013EF887C|nr:MULTISPECIES: HAMP domain-containing sensor histidine kinase [unclassified Legionella]MDI9819225.1 HAMP domain-containing sensor histidine kinase [Legionella sp. PL877]
MKSKSLSIKNVFFRKMGCSAIFQIIFLSIFLILSQQFITKYQNNEIRESLIINDTFSLEEITQYVLLNNQNALDLALLNLAQERKMDHIKFVPARDIRLDSLNCSGKKNIEGICHKKGNFFMGVTRIENRDKTLGFVLSEKKYKAFFSIPVTKGLVFIIAIVLIIYIFNTLFILLSMRKIIAKDTKNLIDYIHDLKHGISPNLSVISITEYKDIAQRFINEHEQILFLQQDKLYYETKKEISEQVAHDIRSPIAAINAIVSTLENVPKEKLYLIKNSADRINDIANNLLLNSGNHSSDVIHNIDDAHPELIYKMLDNLVYEKRYEYKDLDINITLNSNKEDKNCYSLVNSVKFIRVMSNLINNSVDAIKGSGNIGIVLKADNDFVNIILTDNGCGIPENILPHICNRGFSFNREKNSGLGLFFANQYINQINGCMEINSVVNNGTIITIKLIRTQCKSTRQYHIEQAHRLAVDKVRHFNEKSADKIVVKSNG